MTVALASIIVASISALVSVLSLRFGRAAQSDLEKFKIELRLAENEATAAAEARRLLVRYRDPLLRTAYDLQSRLFNMLRPNGFRGAPGSDYFTNNTLFVIADFLGWLEIIRRDMQFLDIGAVEAARTLNNQIWRVQDLLASTSGDFDPYFLHRGEQRAIGELMMTALPSTAARPAPRYETIGYARFTTQLADPEFSRWFGRLATQLPMLPKMGSVRMARVQNALVDLIDLLDNDHRWYATRPLRLAMAGTSRDPAPPAAQQAGSLDVTG
jgi:hypothetical protein